MSVSDRKVIKVRGSFFMYTIAFLYFFGGLFSCYFLIKTGLKFESKYAFLYLGGGIMLMPFFMYETLWGLPGFLPPKRALFTIETGKDGRIVQKKKSIAFEDIKDIEFKRNPITLFNEIFVETYSNKKKIRISTYALLLEVNFYDLVDKHIYPYMTEDAKRVWNHKLSNDPFLSSIDYERKIHHTD
ncbi:DUF5381 family protein [Fictibacillus iocasae]|uniref:DUF5381 family protein n=1 Tax=Fictibacillus iocasae TaxID=2715437 RepID=A0ABW2NS02_9BACL